MTLVDSDRRKVAFLQTAIRTLGLSHCTAIQARIEELAPVSARHLSARALAPMPKLMPYVVRHLRPGGTAWLMKGENWKAEVESVNTSWHFDLREHPSRTQSGAAILELTDIRHG